MRNFLRSISSPSAAARDLVVLIHGFGAHKASLLPLSVAISDGRHILNHGYLTRQALLHEHSDDLIDVVSSRIQKERPKRVHFVTHSFGGCVLRSAFGRGLQEVLPTCSGSTRAVLIGPPLRGAVFGRNFNEMALGETALPKRAREVLRDMARYYVGPKSGLQLISKSPEWFEQVGSFPTDNLEILVIEGKLPVTNPIIGQESDGIVTCQETMLPTPHRRYTVSVPHNLMLLSPSIMRVVKEYLDGNNVGDAHPGVPLVVDGKYSPD